MTFWGEVKDNLKNRVSSHNYDSWFRDIECLERDSDTVYLGVENPFLKAWIEENYLGLISDSIGAVTGRTYEVEIRVWDQQPQTLEAGDDAPDECAIDVAEDKAARVARLDAESAVTWPGRAEQSDSSKTDSGRRSPTASCDYEPESRDRTFDGFVSGPENEFAKEACCALGRKDTSFQLLYIYAGVGLGKTHLLEAIASGARRRGDDVRKLSSETFMNQMVRAIKANNMDVFRRQMRQGLDLFLLDDVQFLAGKEATQVELFHTLNALDASPAMVAITGNRAPASLEGMDDRLKNRLVGGLCVDIQPPGSQTRAKILRRKAEHRGVTLADDVVEFLANQLPANVRQLEGVVTRLVAKAELLDRTIRVPMVRKELERLDLDRQLGMTPVRIIETVAREFDVTASQLKGNGRKRKVTFPRQVAMYLAREHTDKSYPQLGEAFGGKDHTTVLAAFRKVNKRLEEGDNEMQKAVDRVESSLGLQ